MGWFRPSRDFQGPDPFQTWKVIIFALGAAFALAGIFTNRDWLVLSAIGILAVGAALRFFRKRPPQEEEQEED